MLAGPLATHAAGQASSETRAACRPLTRNPATGVEGQARLLAPDAEEAEVSPVMDNTPPDNASVQVGHHFATSAAREVHIVAVGHWNVTAVDYDGDKVRLTAELEHVELVNLAKEIAMLKEEGYDVEATTTEEGEG